MSDYIDEHPEPSDPSADGDLEEEEKVIDDGYSTKRLVELWEGAHDLLSHSPRGHALASGLSGFRADLVDSVSILMGQRVERFYTALGITRNGRESFKTDSYGISFGFESSDAENLHVMRERLVERDVEAKVLDVDEASSPHIKASVHQLYVKFEVFDRILGIEDDPSLLIEDLGGKLTRQVMGKRGD